MTRGPHSTVALLFTAASMACWGYSAFAQSAQTTAEPRALQATTAPTSEEASGSPIKAPVVEKPIPSLLGGWAWRHPAPLTEPIETDRPDYTESPNTVPRGHAQLEGGYTFTYCPQGRTRSSAQTAPELLLRAGLLDQLELRVGWDGYTWTHEGHRGPAQFGQTATIADWSQGGADQYLGFKWKLVNQQGLRPDFALIPAVTVPTGSDGFSSGNVDPQIKLAWGYDLAPKWDVTGNVNFVVPTQDGTRFLQTQASASLEYELLADLSAFFEYYGFYPSALGTDCAHTLDTGLLWRITPNFQVDWRIGGGLNDEADRFFAGVGFAIRF